MTKSGMSGVIGIVLIIIGISILGDEYIHIDKYWIRSYGFLLAGILGLALTAPRKIAFVFSFLAFMGLFYLAGEFDLVSTWRPFTISAATLSLGFSCFVLFALGRRKWELFGFGVVLSTLGTFFTSFAFGYISDGVFFDAIETWWPVILIAFGIVMLIGGSIARKQNSIPAES